MTFRRRIVVLAAGAVAAAIALAAVVTYVVVRQNLRDGVDASLRELRPKVVFVSRVAPAKGVAGEAGQSTTGGADDVFQAQLPPTALGGSAGVVQVTLRNGDVIRSAPGARLPESAAVREVARGERGESLEDATVRGEHARVLTTRGPDGSTLQIAKPLTEVDDALGRLRWILFAVTVGGVGVAAGLGVGVSRAATPPPRGPDRRGRAGHGHRRPAPPHRGRGRRRARAPRRVLQRHARRPGVLA